MLGLMRTLAQERPRQEMHDVDTDMYAPRMCLHRVLQRR